MSATMKARPTVYKGIKMRSRLEAGFAMWLDKWHFDWEYESECFAHERGQYLPDFLLRDVLVVDRRADVYIECKPIAPTSEMRETLDAQWRAIAASKPAALMAVMYPRDDEFVHVLTVPHFSTWVWVYEPSGDDEFTLGIQCPVANDRMPWPDDYWKAT